MNDLSPSRTMLWLVAAVLVCACCLLAPVSAFAASAPTVTAVSPASGPMTGGTSVTVSGTGFAGATAVKFGSQSATSYTVNSDGSITATAPQNVAALYNGAANSGKGALAYSGSVDVTVTTSAGTSATSSADQFTYNWTLTVDNGSQRKVYSLSDLEAMTPVYSGYGGFLKGDPPYTVYQYTGTTLLNLLADSGGYTSGAGVKFGTADNYGMAPFTYADVTDPSDNFTTSDPATGDPVTVTDLSVVLTYGTGSPWALLPTTIGPEIALLTPSAEQVTMGYDWPHFLTSITTPTALPTVTSLSPAGGLATGGVTVTITGTNLGSVATVKFGSVAAAGFLVNSQTQITAVAPAEAAGTVDVTVTTPSGVIATSAADRYTYSPDGDPPAVTGLSPANGMVAGGTSVTIAGSDFYGVSAVDFGATAATSFTVTDSSHITAVAPAHGAGDVDVTVTTPWGTSSTTGPGDDFTYAVTDLANATIAPVPAQVYTGKIITPALAVTCDGNALAQGADYTIAYTHNTAVGKATATISGIGTCAGTSSVDFVIIPAKATLLRVTAGVAKATVAWKKSGGGVGGYRISYRKKGSAPWKAVNVTSGLSKLVRHLARGKAYTFRVCAFKIVSGTAYYGAWSRSRTVTIK